MKLISERRPLPLQSAQRGRPETNGSVQGWSERIALAALILTLVVLPAILLGYQFVLRPALSDVRVIDIVAAAPEAGGFQPDTIRIPAGDRVRLRFSVPDVTHGIAIGPGLELDLGHVDPGEVRELETTIDRPGRYTIYCNTWCSPNHWRMRATIEVYDPQEPNALPGSDVPDPVFESLARRGVDIDAMREAAIVPMSQPSAARGAEIVGRLGDKLPKDLGDPFWRRTHTPAEASNRLVSAGLTRAEAWDAVAHLWLTDLDLERLQKAESLYAKNCAACHGETGDGRGPGADALGAQGIGQHSSMSVAGEPAAFADPRTMLGGTSEIYYAKLRRGGMGTGMPSFGPILTPDETWSLVDYLWTFVFDPERFGGAHARRES